MTLPGVPTTIYTPSFNIFLSSPILVPPVQMWTVTFKYSPKTIQTLAIYYASSLVGAKIKAYVLGEVLSITYKTPIEKVAVFPVPD